jgi:hypothetical protein
MILHISIQVNIVICRKPSRKFAADAVKICSKRLSRKTTKIRLFVFEPRNFLSGINIGPTAAGLQFLSPVCFRSNLRRDARGHATVALVFLSFLRRESWLFAWLLASPVSPSASFLALANFGKHERHLCPLDTVLCSLPYSSGLRRSEPDALQIGNIYIYIFFSIILLQKIYVRKRTNLYPVWNKQNRQLLSLFKLS